MNNDTDAMKLKPCPLLWCNSDSVKMHQPRKNGKYHAECMKCGATGPSSQTEAEAFDRWNEQRTPSLAAPDIHLHKAQMNSDESNLQKTQIAPEQPTITQADIDCRNAIYLELTGLCVSDDIAAQPDWMDIHLARHRAPSPPAQDGLVDALRRARGTVQWAVCQHDIGTPYRKTDEEILAQIDAALASIEVKSS